MKILFICTANICRSFIAERIFRKKSDENGRSDIEVSSASLIDMESAPADPRTFDILEEKGFDGHGHKSRLLTEDMVAGADKIIVMETIQKEMIIDKYPDAEDKIYLLKSFSGEIYSSEHEEALVRLFYAAKRRKGAALLTGEIGSGKTMMSKVFIQQLPEDEYDIGLITNPTLEPSDFLKEILYQLGLNPDTNSKADLLNILNEKMLENMKQDKTTLLIIDEAQLIFRETFEEIRLLLNFQLNNRFPLTVILMGQPELRDVLRTIKQLDQRIAIKYHLNPLNFEETVKYIVFRLQKAGLTRGIFTRQAVDEVYNYSQGIPRMINNVCDMSLLIGFSSKEKVVDSKIIKEVVKDLS
jgi:general secretion pathway protein A